MSLKKRSQTWPGNRDEPSRVRITFSEDGTEVGDAEGYWGSPRILSEFLEAQYAYGLSDIVSDEKRGPIAVLYGLEVAEPLRRRGIGSMLVKETMDFFRERKVRRVYVQASEELGVMEEALMAFYERLGFEFCCRTGDAADDPVLFHDIVREQRV